MSNYPLLTDYQLYQINDDEFCNYYDGYILGQIMFNNEWHYYHCCDVLDDYTRIYNVFILTNELKDVLRKEWEWKDLAAFTPIFKLQW